jgi:hypothetical protein
LQLKKIADFNLDEEDRFRNMSYYNYLFHIFALKQAADEEEARQKQLAR